MRLILGEPPAGAGIAAARIAGAALLGLAVACTAAGPAAGLAVYSLGVTGVLAPTALPSGLAGALIWPVAALHLAIAVLLAWQVRAGPRS